MLEWLSFIFAGGNLLAGPCFELSDYLAFIQRREAWDARATRQPSLAQQYEAGVRAKCGGAILTAERRSVGADARGVACMRCMMQ